MNTPSSIKHIILGITGASGAIYACRLIECLTDGGAHVHLIATEYGKRLLHDELAITEVSALGLLGHESDQITVNSCRDVGAIIASGSYPINAMIICPCSSNTLAAVATGLANNLLCRAAAVTLKETRPLIVVPREMPMSQIDLQNALRLSQVGAIICPASPGFYMMPQSINDLVDFVVGKLLDLVSVPHTLNTRWAAQLEITSQMKKEPLSD